MRGKPLTAHFSQLFLAIKTATYATFLPKEENKSSKNERNFQQDAALFFYFRIARRVLRIQDVNELSFGIYIWTWKNKKQHNSKLSLTFLD